MLLFSFHSTVLLHVLNWVLASSQECFLLVDRCLIIVFSFVGKKTDVSQLAILLLSLPNALYIFKLLTS